MAVQAGMIISGVTNMASIREMMELAEYKSKVENPVPVTLQGGFEGYIAGLEKGREGAIAARAASLDNAFKIIEMQEKMQKMELDKRSQRMDENIGKALGIVPLDSMDRSSGLDAAWDQLGANGEKIYPNTPEGTLSRMLNSGDVEVSWNRGRGFSVRARGAKEFQSRAGEAQDISKKRAILEIARDIVRNKKVRELESQTPPELRGTPMEKSVNPKDVPIDPDDLMAAMPMATAIWEKDAKKWESLPKERRADEADPVQGLLSQVADLKSEIDKRKTFPGILSKEFWVGTRKQKESKESFPDHEIFYVDPVKSKSGKMVLIEDSTGARHNIPEKNIPAARKRDPGLKIIFKGDDR
jgi:hypothetical protein